MGIVLTLGCSCPYNQTMKYIYLSPHLDDAALSCGGLIWDQVHAGESVEVWNIFAGNPPPGEFSLYAQVHHKIWGLTAKEAIASRRNEDVKAMDLLGVKARYYDFPDAIYRKHPKTGEPMYTSGEDLFGGMDPGDGIMIRRVSIELSKNLSQDSVLIAPLTVGNHIDHQIVRTVAEHLSMPVWYYPEFPYTREFSHVIPDLVPPKFQRVIVSISKSGLVAWQDSVAAYTSQISSFWTSLDEMKEDILVHFQKFDGITLWQPDEIE